MSEDTTTRRSKGSRFVKPTCEYGTDIPEHQVTRLSKQHREMLLPGVTEHLPEPARSLVSVWLRDNPDYVIRIANLITLTDGFAAPHVMLHVQKDTDPRYKLYCKRCRGSPADCRCDTPVYNHDPGAATDHNALLKLRFGDPNAPTSPRVRTGLPAHTDDRYKAAVRFWLKHAPKFTITAPATTLTTAYINEWVDQHTPGLLAYASTWFDALPKILDFTTDKNNRHTPPALWLDPFDPLQDPDLVRNTSLIPAYGGLMPPINIACYSLLIDRVTKYVNKAAHPASCSTVLAFAKKKPHLIDGIIGLLTFTNGLAPPLAYVTVKGVSDCKGVPDCQGQSGAVGKIRLTYQNTFQKATKRYTGFARAYGDMVSRITNHLESEKESHDKLLLHTFSHLFCDKFNQWLLTVWPTEVNRILNEE